MKRHHITITRATENDLEETTQVITEGYSVNYKEKGPISKPYFPDDYSECVRGGSIRLFVAKVEEKIVGSVQYEDKGGIAHLSQMVVLPNYRSRGIGSQLLETAEKTAKEEGFQRVQLTAMNEKGLPEYYKKRGYTEIGTRVRPSNTQAIMQKILK